MNERKSTRIFVILFIVLFIAAAMFIPRVDYFTELAPRTQAAHLKVAIQATATATPTSSDEATATPESTSTDDAVDSGVQTAEVVITIKSAETEQPEEKSATGPEWETSLRDGTATLTLVVLNEGDVPVQPCLMIPAVYDREAVPVNPHALPQPNML